MLKDRPALSGNSFAELVLRHLSQPAQGSLHAFKYWLAFVIDGVCVPRYDNEAGKGDPSTLVALDRLIPRRCACWLISGMIGTIGEKVTNELAIGVASRDTVSARLIDAFKTENPQGASINFENERLLWKTLTLERWNILRALTGAEPMTVRRMRRGMNRTVRGSIDR
jgi:hypothetical protein